MINLFGYALFGCLQLLSLVVLLLVIITTFSADTWADVFGGGGLDSTLGFQLEREYTPLVKFLPIDFAYLIGLGAMIGLLAELYTRYVLSMQRQGNRWFGDRLVLRMTISGLILGAVYAALPTTFHDPNQLQHLIADGKADIRLALASFVVLFFSTGLAAASGAPGGLFMPMLTLGGAIGLACGGWVEALTGHVPSTYVFAGMGAFVAGCSRTPISAMFLAFALTKDLLILKPILVACLMSFLVARLFNPHSIYERQMDMELISEERMQKQLNRHRRAFIAPTPPKGQPEEREEL